MPSSWSVIYYVITGKFLSLSVPQFPHLSKEVDSSACATVRLRIEFYSPSKMFRTEPSTEQGPHSSVYAASIITIVTVVLIVLSSRSLPQCLVLWGKIK